MVNQTAFFLRLFRSLKTGRDVTVERIGSSTVFIGSTPRGIRRQHFREISDQLGFFSEIDLAKAVVANSVTERWEMLKRFYVDKNAVLSGLSCFTAGSESFVVAADKERQDLKRAQRSLEQTQADESHEVPKKSKKKLKKQRAKAKLPGKDATCDANLERHELHRLDNDDDLHGRNQSILTAAFQGKETNLNKYTQVIETKDPSNALNRIEDGVSDVNSRNCRTEAKNCQLNQRHQLQSEDENCSSSAWEWNREHAVEFQASSVDDSSVISVSILDEFLSTSSCRGFGKSEKVDKTVKKVKCCRDKKQNKQMDKTDKNDTIKEKKPTSVLDEFI